MQHVDDVESGQQRTQRPEQRKETRYFKRGSLAARGYQDVEKLSYTSFIGPKKPVGVRR